MSGDFTTAQLDALTKAIASGTLTVRHGDKSVTYQSIEAMISLRDRMQRELGTTEKRPMRHLLKFSRGDR